MCKVGWRFLGGNFPWEPVRPKKCTRSRHVWKGERRRHPGTADSNCCEDADLNSTVLQCVFQSLGKSSRSFLEAKVAVITLSWRLRQHPIVRAPLFLVGEACFDFRAGIPPQIS